MPRQDLAGQMRARFDVEIAVDAHVALEASRHAHIAGALDLALDGQIGRDDRFAALAAGGRAARRGGQGRIARDSRSRRDCAPAPAQPGGGARARGDGRQGFFAARRGRAGRGFLIPKCHNMTLPRVRNSSLHANLENVIGPMSLNGDVARQLRASLTPSYGDAEAARARTIMQPQKQGHTLVPNLDRLKPDRDSGADGAVSRRSLPAESRPRRRRLPRPDRQHADARLRAPRRADRARGADDQVLRGRRGPRGIQRAVEELVLGAAHPARRERRARTAQTPGGCGALRVGAELDPRGRARPPRFMSAIRPGATTRRSSAAAGSKLERYPYYDAAAHGCASRRCWSGWSGRAAGDVVLVHACCHNPTRRGSVDRAMAGAHRAARRAGASSRSWISPTKDSARISTRMPRACGWSTEALPEALIAVSYLQESGPVPRARRRAHHRERERIPRRRRAEPRAADRAQHLLDAARSRRGDRRAHLRRSCAHGSMDRGARGDARPDPGNARAARGAVCARRRAAGRSISSTRSAACFRCSACRARAVEALRDAASHLHDVRQPHESRRHHAAQRRVRREAIAAQRSSRAPAAARARA